MKAKLSLKSFEPRSLKVATAASEIVRVTGVDITVDLFSPGRPCSRCEEKAEVFIGPKNVCASCWVQLVTRYPGECAKQLRAQLPAMTAALGSAATA
jgi:hypothetical protein